MMNSFPPHVPEPKRAWELRFLGKGACGTVWTPDGNGPTVAIKKYTNNRDRSLQQEAEVHKRLLAPLPPSILTFNVPKFYEFWIPGAGDWELRQHFFTVFPTGHQEYSELLFSERIPSFPRSVREALIDKYCPPNMRDRISEVKKDAENQDCIIRPLLGRRRRRRGGRRREERGSRLGSSSSSSSSSSSWSLRDYPLYLDQLEEDEPCFGSNADAYARAMADALALMHWSAGVDAAGVEFVLAPCRAGEQGFDSPVLGKHRLWILDFDCCRALSMGKRGMLVAAERFYQDDYFFYPRPGRASEKSQHLWAVFKKRFLQISVATLKAGRCRSDLLMLPALFIALIETDPRAQEPDGTAL